MYLLVLEGYTQSPAFTELKCVFYVYLQIKLLIQIVKFEALNIRFFSGVPAIIAALCTFPYVLMYTFLGVKL